MKRTSTPRPRITSRQSQGRVTIMGGILAAMFVLAAGSQAYVQVIGAKDILAKGERRGVLGTSSDMVRLASIYSSDGKIVAQSRDVYTLSLHYKHVPKSRAFYMDLAAASGVPMTELMPVDDEAKSREWRACLSPVQKQQVQKVQSKWDVDGISLTPSLSRIYPLGEAASGFIGTVRYAEPVNGMEKSFFPLLRGADMKPDSFVGLTDAALKAAQNDTRTADIGPPVTLTIDSRIQLAAAQAVKEAVEKHKAKRGTAIVLNPKTGDLAAMANWPSYNPDGNIELGSDFNASYMATYEPGSTFKLFTLAIGLDLGLIKPEDHFNSTAVMNLGHGMRVSNHEGHAYGSITPRQAIAYSCNVTAAQWSLKIGKKDMEKYTDSLGLYKKTSLGLPGERAGKRADSKYALNHLIATWGFGQSMNVEPVALIGAFGALANDGKLLKPRLVRAIGTAELEPEVVGQVLKPESCRTVIDMARSVFEQGGTGADLNIPGLDLAGKTGTAQRLRGANGDIQYVSSFVGFAPASDPKWVILVMVENPQAGGYYGGTVAGPAFVSIVKRLRDLNLIPASRAPRPESRLSEIYGQPAQHASD